MSEQETIFVSGLYLNKVHENAPAFIITNQSIHVDNLIKWLQDNKHLANEKGYINIVGKESKDGKRYLSVDTWKPDKKEDSKSVTPSADIKPEDVPF